MDCYVQFPSVRRRVCGVCRHAHGYEPICATQPPVFTGVYRGCRPAVVESPEFDAGVVSSDMSTITSRFSPLNPRMSLVSKEIMDRVVVESPLSDVMPVVDLDMFPVTNQSAPLDPQGSQVSHLSSVQLSPNRVRLDFDLDTIDVFPVFVASPRSGRYLPLISPISSPDPAGIYPLSRLFRRLRRVHHRLRALCRTRRLRRVTAPSGV